MKSLVWFRRDLRDNDNAALYHALKASSQVYCVFVFDTEILDRLSDKADRRVDFIWRSVQELRTALEAKGGGLILLYGRAQAEIPKLAQQLGVQAVYANRDYEPMPIARDSAVAAELAKTGVNFLTFKDQVIFETDEVLTQDSRPYSVFTPYKNTWLKKLEPYFLKPYPVEKYADALVRPLQQTAISLPSIGFMPTTIKIPVGMSGAHELLSDFKERIARYKDSRDYPAIKGPSYLSTHLRFGTISIRTLARLAWEIGGSGAETWLSELIWRDFYFMILQHHPHVATGHAFKPEFDNIIWPGIDDHFQAWCEGRTGYPLIDAAMRQLNQTSYMHNRLRMITASFLVKDLLVDWRKGEDYFARKLLDFDLAANNGGWQWAASTGCDAQPWFRIFNPVTQSEKFDAEGKFIRKYVQELGACTSREIHAPWTMSEERRRTIAPEYPAPIVDHAVMREKALALYKNAA
jgi:deoxyribodipyrimidine photo-lyase